MFPRAQHPPAPPPLVQRKRGAESRFQQKETRKTADPSTPSAARLVHGLRAFTMGFFDTDCCVTYNRHAGKAVRMRYSAGLLPGFARVPIYPQNLLLAVAVWKNGMHLCNHFATLLPQT